MTKLTNAAASRCGLVIAHRETFEFVAFFGQCSITGNLVIAITSPAKNVRYFSDGFDIFASAGLLGLVNPAAALGDEALGKTRRGMSGFTAAETRPYCADPSQGL